MSNSTRTLIVTGASSGIGLAVARHLLSQGHRIIGLARRHPNIVHSAFEAISIDLSRLDELPAQLNELIRQHPGVDGLVCCAGRGQFGGLEQFSYQQIHDLITLNFTSQVYLVRALLPHLKRKPRSDIIFIGSEAALTGGRQGVIYSATKFALRGLAQSLREECARANLRISLINPGMVDTPFFDSLNFRPGEAQDTHLRPEDVAMAVSLALSLRPGAVVDEINLSPLKKLIRFDKKR